ASCAPCRCWHRRWSRSPPAGRYPAASCPGFRPNPRTTRPDREPTPARSARILLQLAYPTVNTSRPPCRIPGRRLPGAPLAGAALAGAPLALDDWVDVPLGRLEQYQRHIDPVGVVLPGDVLSQCVALRGRRR